jgi:hypothetical protein
MRRSAVALSASLVALLVLALPVLADWPGDPGTYKNLGVTHTECLDVDCNPMFNSQSVNASVNFDGTALVCVTTTTYGGPSESGCVSVNSRSLLFQGRYIVGVPETAVALYDDNDVFTRNVTASATSVLGDLYFQESRNEPVQEGDCTGRYVGKRTILNVSGSLTLDGSTDVATGTSSVTDVQVKLRCPKS